MGSVVAVPSSGAQAQELRRTGLVAPWHVGSSWTSAGTGVTCIGRRVVYHWPPRKPFLAVLILGDLLPALGGCSASIFPHVDFLMYLWEEENSVSFCSAILISPKRY